MAFIGCARRQSIRHRRRGRHQGSACRTHRPDRYHISERNLYANVFAVKRPHLAVMFASSRSCANIAAFEAPAVAGTVTPAAAAFPSMISARIFAISTNIWTMSAVRRRRVAAVLDASLITGIDPPPEVESALAAINTAHNMVSSDISLAQATADQRIRQSSAQRDQTLKAQAEVQPLISLASQLSQFEEHRRALALTCVTSDSVFRKCPADLSGDKAMNLLIAAVITFMAASFSCR